MKKREKLVDFNRDFLTEELFSESKSTNLYEDAAKAIVKLVVDGVERKINQHEIITESDYEAIVSSELKKYNSDLAYIYLNRDKII